MPQKGVRPKTDGVAGVLVAIDEELHFGKGLGSPYDKLLIQLSNAKNNFALRFDSLNPKPTIYSRAKKLGIEIEFASKGETLFVRLKRKEPSKEELKEQAQSENEILVLQAIRTGYQTPELIAKFIRDGGKESMDSTIVQITCKRLVEKGSLKLAGGSQQSPKWILNK